MTFMHYINQIPFTHYTYSKKFTFYNCRKGTCLRVFVTNTA